MSPNGANDGRTGAHTRDEALRLVDDFIECVFGLMGLENDIYLGMHAVEESGASQRFDLYEQRTEELQDRACDLEEIWLRFLYQSDSLPVPLASRLADRMKSTAKLAEDLSWALKYALGVSETGGVPIFDVIEEEESGAEAFDRLCADDCVPSHGSGFVTHALIPSLGAILALVPDSAAEPADLLSAFLPREHTPTKEESLILQALYRSRIRLKQYELESATKLADRAIRQAAAVLEKLGWINRDAGQNKGYALSAKGKMHLERSENRAPENDGKAPG